MKKLIIATLITLMLAGSSFGGQTAISSGEQTADAAIYSGSADITAIQVCTDGINDGKVIIYDNTTDSGKVVFEATVTGASHYGGRVFVPPIEVSNGIYVDVTGTGASYFVEYARN